MKTKAIFYHAGCPVCVDAEQMFVDTIDQNRFDVEVVYILAKPKTESRKQSAVSKKQ